MPSITLSQSVKQALLSRPRMPLLLIGSTVLAACVAVTAPLWRIDQATSGCSHAFNAIANSAGDIFQTCSPAETGDGWVRKLSSDAEEQWRQPIDFQSQASEVSEADGSVVLFHDNNRLTWLNADGTERWQRDVVPQGMAIVAHSRVANDRLYVAYGAANGRKTEGIVALNATGDEVWSYRPEGEGMIPTLPEFAVLDSGELMLKLTLQDTEYVAVRGELLAFDAAGNRVQQRPVAKFAQLIDNRKTAFLLEHYTISGLDVSGVEQWRRELFPWDESSWEYPMYLPCAGDGEEEVACGIGGAVTWLAGNGDIINRYGMTDIRDLTYNGEGKWVVTRRTQRDVPSLAYKKTETFSSVHVITDKAVTEQKINLKPSTETSYFCTENPYTFTCTKYTVGDDVTKVFATADKVIAVGYATYPSRSFIAAFALGAP